MNKYVDDNIKVNPENYKSKFNPGNYKNSI